MCIIPNKLKKGDLVGVVSLSDPITLDEAEEVQKSVKKIEELRSKYKIWETCIW